MKKVSAFLLFISVCGFQGCMYYYKVLTVPKVTPQEIKKFDSLDKYLILHQGDAAWNLSSPEIRENTLYGILAPLPWEHLKYKTTKVHGVNRYRKAERPTEKAVVNEVHLYLTDTLIPDPVTGKNIQIPVSAIQKAEVYKKAKGRTSASWILPVIAIPVVFILVIAALYGR